MGEFTLSFEKRVTSLRDEVSGFSVARCERMLQPTELMKNSDQLLTLLDPKWKLPGLILSLDADPQLGVGGRVREIKRVLPGLDESSITRAIWSLCTHAFRPRGFMPQPSDPLDGIIAHLTKACSGNVHDSGVVMLTSSDHDGTHPKVIADLRSDVRFCSLYRPKEEDIPHTRNNWVCYDFKARRIVPTHYSIRSPARSHGPGCGNYPKSWLVEISTDGEHWVEIDRRENNSELAEERAIRTFEVSGNQLCRQIRLVNIGRNHQGYDCLCVLALEIFGSLIESLE
jgi:hypothetical protein